MTYEFDTTEPPTLRITMLAGTLAIEATKTSKTVVDVEAMGLDPDDLEVSQRGRDIVVRQRKRLSLRNGQFHVRIWTPHGVGAEIHVASTEIRATGRLAEVEVHSASGNLEIERAEYLEAHGASGGVVAGHVGTRLDVGTASGNVVVNEVAGRVTIATASGNQTIKAIGEGLVSLKSMSGDLQLGIKRGSRLHVDARSMSGRTSSELEIQSVVPDGNAPLVDLKATTMSGDIRIMRA
jgi:DUF4097 and DUF4098 domain-containing protein YvlB